MLAEELSDDDIKDLHRAIRFWRGVSGVVYAMKVSAPWILGAAAVWTSFRDTLIDWYVAWKSR